MKNSLLITLLAILLTGILFSCSKEEEAEFAANFRYEYVNDNTILYTNTSVGEYYSLTWDFGNGEVVTTTDKRETFQVYYPEEGAYSVGLKVLNFSGSTKTNSQSVSIENTIIGELEVQFTAVPNEGNPNYVLLTNTTVGVYNSYKWVYLDQTISDENEHSAFFPLAGTFTIELQVMRGEEVYTSAQSIVIENDDQGGLNLFWSEEFNYSGLPDANIWNMETGGGGWGNNELQYYTNREENASVGEGVLTITAKEEAYSGRNYTSARITTQNKFNFKYGKIEARIKLPYGQGIWPAFWMLGENFQSAGWPACGEIDIMEMIGGAGNDNTTHSTLHWSNNNEHASYGDSYSLPSGILADDFHVFSVEWNETSIKGLIDDHQYFIIDITSAQLSEFHEDFFLILNIAVGGNWPGAPNAATEFPQTMQIDYIRIYKD